MKTIKLLLCFSLFTFSFSLCKGQSWLWAKAAGDSGVNAQSDAWSLATDHSGNIYEAGLYYGNIIFGSDSLVANPLIMNPASYLVKYDQNGNVLWLEGDRIGGYGASSGLSVSTDLSGNIYLAGTYQDSTTFGSFHFFSSSGADMYLVKYSPAGTLLWAKSTSATGNGIDNYYTLGSATDGDGNTYVTGSFQDILIAGPDTLTNGGKQHNVFLIKYSSAGNVLWATSALLHDTGCNGFGNYVALDKAGYVYVSGYFKDTLVFGSDSVKNGGGKHGNIFLAKFSSSGNAIWVRSPSMPSRASGPIVPEWIYLFVTDAVDASGNIYLTGSYIDTLQFGSYMLTNNAAAGATYLAKYDSAGNVLWAETDKPAYGSQGYFVTTDKWNNIYMSGDLLGIDTFAGIPPLYYGGAKPSFLVELDSNGKALCGTVIANFNDDNNPIAADPLGANLYFSGDVGLSPYCAFGTDTLFGASNEWTFLAKWKTCSPEGINELKGESENIKVFPNPNGGRFTIETSVETGQSSVEIYNVLGEKVYSRFEIQNPTFQIDLSTNPNGIYLYRVLNEDGSLVGEGKVIVQK